MMPNTATPFLDNSWKLSAVHIYRAVPQDKKMPRGNHKTVHQLLPADGGRGFCALCAGSCAGKKADAGVFGYAELTDCAARKGGGP